MFLSALSFFFLALAVLGGFLLVAQAVALHSVRLEGKHPLKALPGISILKPLCGADDELEGNLEVFSRLRYAGDWEVVLGVKTEQDSAYPVALGLCAQYPERFRVVIQEDAPGLNPKVNQLITLSRAARHDLLVVSDSNVRVPPEYLLDIAAHFEDPAVGCVTHPIAGVGGKTLGAVLDNLQQAWSTAGVVAAQRLAKRALVVGKSMALRRRDLERLGGFESVRDVLAEDHVLGSRVQAELKKRVVVSMLPVQNVAVRLSVRDFFRRHARWSVLQRHLVSSLAYSAQPILSPVMVAVVGFALHPSVTAGAVLLALNVVKLFPEWLAAYKLGAKLPARVLGLVWMKDCLTFGCWVWGFCARSVSWRGNRLYVGEGTRLSRERPGRLRSQLGLSTAPP